MPTATTEQPLILQAIEALNLLDRRKAVRLLREDIAAGPSAGERWRSVAQLAGTIGAKVIELEAMRRFSLTQPQTLDHVLAYAQTLSRFGRSGEAITILDALPADVQEHPSVHHFRGMVDSEQGQFDSAVSHFRKALAKAPLAPHIWHGLSVAKTFIANDPDIDLMEAIRPGLDRAPPEVLSVFLNGLAKAYHDAGDFTKASTHYIEGANLMRGLASFDATAWHRRAAQTIHDYTPTKFGQLTPSKAVAERVIFVNGLPRSGTTLVEQILTSHSAVVGGGELNVMDQVLMPAGDLSLASALSYEARAQSEDPWGDIGKDYQGLVAAQYDIEGKVVDKTLNRSLTMGLQLHMLPHARVVWLRRDPADNALSIFRTHFRDSMAWSWSLRDIADYMRGEDALYAHWTSLFPDRILTVPYEGLVSEPETWIRKILAHTGLAEEPQVFVPHQQTRSVMTASVAQVREPISTERVGSAAAYGTFMDEFRTAYSR